MKRGKPLTRNTPLRAKKGLSRSSRLKRGRGPGRNDERREREWKRSYGSEERVRWMRDRPSVVSGEAPCVSAHVPDPEGPSGMGRKADACWTVPLTWEEHEEYHRIGPESFAAKHDMTVEDLQDEARKTDAAWQDHKGAG